MAELKRVNHWWWIWDFEKEERWLNAMAQQGWTLERVSGLFTYWFRRTEPGEYILRLEMREKDDEYMALLEDAGATYVGRIAQWIYFRKPAAEGPFDLFSDVDSRTRYLERIARLLRVVLMINLVLGLINEWNPVMRIGWLNLLAAGFVAYALGRIRGKQEEVTKERWLHE